MRSNRVGRWQSSQIKRPLANFAGRGKLPAEKVGADSVGKANLGEIMPSYFAPHQNGLSILAITVLLSTMSAQAEEIVVSNYGVSANGMPYAVAMAKGYFKDEGANVTGIITSAGGGTTLRNMLAGNAPYAEVNPNAVIAAIQQGADIKIISDNVSTVAEFVWAVKPDSAIKTPKDLKGKKIGYTNPRSTSQALATMVLAAGGLKPEDAELVKTGGFGEGVAALDANLVDAAPIPEPLWSKFQGKYRAIAKASELLPPARQCCRGIHYRAVRSQRRVRPRRHPSASQGRRIHGQESGRVGRHHCQGLQYRANRCASCRP